MLLRQLSQTATLLACAATAFTYSGYAMQVKTVILPPTGEYATIDNKPSMAAIQALGGTDAIARQKQIAAIVAHPDRFTPPVLYALSEVLFAEGRRDDAAFYFYAAQLRARFDANRTADETARDGVSVLNERYGPPINKYTFQDIPKLEALIPRVVAWDRKTPHNYEARWLAPHGMGAFTSDGKSAPLMLPKAQWDKIAETTRNEYESGFKDALVELKKRGSVPTAKP